MRAAPFAETIADALGDNADVIDSYQRMCSAIDLLGETALKVSAERNHLIARAKCALEVIDLAKARLSMGDTEGAMTQLLRAQLELAS